MAERTLVKNTTYFTAALTFQKILSFIYFWFISNSLFAESLGQYVFALSFTTLFSIFIDLGLSPILTREASKDNAGANRLLRNVIGLKLPLAAATLLAAWLFINVTGKPPEVKLLVYLASFVMVLDSFSLSFWVMFRARHTLTYESIGTILVQIIIFTIGIVALKTTGSVRHLMLALLVASLFNFCFSALLLKRKLHFSLKPEWSAEVIDGLLRVVPAFALAGVFVKIYNTVDSILLSYLVGDAAVGLFAIPAKVVYAFQQVIPAAFSAVIFPAFSTYYKRSPNLLHETFLKAFRYLTIISLPLAAGLVTLVGPIINTLWPRYAAVIPTFIVMSLAIPFIFLAFPTGYLLNACDRQRQTTWNRGIITALAVILNLALIPSLSFYGAGIAFLVTNVVLLGLDFIWVRKLIPLKLAALGSFVGKSALATAVMVLLLLGIRHQVHVFVAAPIGVLAYFAVLIGIRGFRFSELTVTKAR